MCQCWLTIAEILLHCITITAMAAAMAGSQRLVILRCAVSVDIRGHICGQSGIDFEMQLVEEA